MFLINGEPRNSLSVNNRGLQYGDGVFETIAVLEKQPLCWLDHMNRLARSCQRLGLDCPSFDCLLNEASELIINGHPGVLKIIITRGEGGRGYRPPAKGTPPVRIMGLYPWPDYPDNLSDDGIRVRICRTRLACNPLLAGIKHLNRLEQVLARAEWEDDGVSEGLMLDTRGFVIEGTMTNLFMIKDNELQTPDLSQSGIEGIVRENIFRLVGKMKLELNLSDLDLDSLYSADEIFLCNSIIGVWPVKAVEEHLLEPGPVTRMIRQQLIKERIIAA